MLRLNWGKGMVIRSPDGEKDFPAFYTEITGAYFLPLVPGDAPTEIALPNRVEIGRIPVRLFRRRQELPRSYQEGAFHVENDDKPFALEVKPEGHFLQARGFPWGRVGVIPSDSKSGARKGVSVRIRPRLPPKGEGITGSGEDFSLGTHIE